MTDKQKSPIVEISGRKFLRIPIKTHIVTADDNMAELIKRYAEDQYQSGDIIVMAESVVAITQGRAINVKDIKIGLLARIMWRFVRKVPYGTGLRSPETMQCAIAEVGGIRIVFAALLGGFTRAFGRRGDFYRIAGMQAALIDAAFTSPIPPYDQCVVLGPKDPDKVAESVGKATGVDAAIVDVNDIGGSWVIGATDSVDRKLLENIMRDNPLGQGDEQTPVGIVREIK